MSMNRVSHHEPATNPLIQPSTTRNIMLSSENASSPIKVKCLLVDDLEENLLALSALLQQDDVDLLQARSGAEALELLLVHDVALAFLDVQMPDMDGFELAELIRGTERTRNIPLIFVTAGSHDKNRHFKGYETGAVDFLYKPIEPHILKNKADIFFQLYRQKQQLAQELQQRTETLRLNEMFMAVLGHDLRNPLSAILTGAHLLLKRSDNEAVQKTATLMLSSGKWMNRMIKDMLDLAQARLGGGLPVKYSSVDLKEIIDHVIQEHLASVPDAKIEVRFSGETQAQVDPDRFAQVVSNLVGNAIQHGDNASIEVELDGSQEAVVFLSVSNKGRIPDELLPHIFNPFRGGDRQIGENKGLGLGLYIVQQIVHGHKGSISVHSDENNRTTFKVELPRGTSTPAELAPL